MTVTPPAARPTPAPRAPRARVRRGVPVAVLAAAAVAATGCGSDGPSTTNAAATSTGAVPSAALADDVPARTAAFAEATLQPGGDSRKAIERLVALVGGGPRSGALGALRLGGDLLPKGRTLRGDVLPHLGEHAAAFLLGGEPAKDGSRTAAASADGAIVAEVRDAAKLREAIGTGGEAKTVAGQTIRVRGDHAIWIGDDIAAVGSEPAVRAAIGAADGDDLGSNDRFTAALGQVRATNPIGLAFVDLQQAPALNAAFSGLGDRARALGAGGRGSKAGSSALGSLPKALRDQVERRLGSKGASRAKGRGFSLTLPASDATAAMALELTPGRLVVRSGGTDATPPANPEAGSDAVAALPAGSWLAFGGGAAGAPAKGSPGALALDRLTGMLGADAPAGLRDALAGVESVSGGAQGQRLLAARGGLVLRAKDGAAATALLRQLGEVFDGKGGPGGLTAKPTTIRGTSEGLVVGLPGLPVQIAAGVEGDRLAIGLGPQSVTTALAPKERFVDDPTYARAKDLLGGTAPSLVVQPKPLTDLLASLGGGLGGMLGGMGGSGGIDDLLGGAGADGPKGSGPGALLGSGGLDKVLDAAERVKLVTAGREATGPTTWRGGLVVEYDDTAPGTKKP